MLSSLAVKNSSSGRPFLLLWLALIAGCAGASVSSGGDNQAPVVSNRPASVFVYPFAVTADDVTLNQSIVQRAYRAASKQDQTQDQLEVAHQAATDLANQIVKELQGLGFTASMIPRGQQVLAANVLVVDGAFTDINEGNRLRRTVIGFGMGQSSVDTQVHVYQVTANGPQQLMDFTTHADSGKMPGAVIAAPAGAAGGAAAATAIGVNVASGGVKAVTSSTGMMTKRSADQAVAYMSQYFASQGWIPQNLVKDPKMADSDN